MSDNDNTKGGGLATLKSALEETGIIYYQLKPAIASVVDNLTKMTVWFNNLSEPIKRVITNVMLQLEYIWSTFINYRGRVFNCFKSYRYIWLFVPIILRAKVAFRAFVIGMKPLCKYFGCNGSCRMDYNSYNCIGSSIYLLLMLNLKYLEIRLIHQ